MSAITLQKASQTEVSRVMFPVHFYIDSILKKLQIFLMFFNVCFLKNKMKFFQIAFDMGVSKVKINFFEGRDSLEKIDY
jgi:hypothetical protein